MKSERVAKIHETIRQATQSLISTLSTSYGPKGLDKMLIRDNKSLVTNDGATILGFYKTHPIHKILSDISSTQDANCGDGTTSVVLLSCCLFTQLVGLLERGFHPSRLSDALELAKQLAVKYIDDIKIKVKESEFHEVAMTALNSKIASKSVNMASIAQEALSQTDRKDLRVIKKIGGTIDDIELCRSVLLNKKTDVQPGNYKLLLLQFCLSAPKTNMESKVIIDDYSQVEQFVKEEREYLLDILRKVKKSGANLLILQKSLLRESCSELAKHFLKKLGIAVVDNVERADVEYLSGILGIKSVSDVDLIGEPLQVEVGQRMDMLEIKGYGHSIIVCGCDQMIVDEAARSLDDVLGVVQSLKREPSIVPGGGSVEAGIAAILDKHSGAHSLVLQEVSRGFLMMPYYLVQNAGVNPVEMVSSLSKNVTVNHHIGISLRTGRLADMVNEERVIQPAGVSRSMVILAIEAVQMLIRIDDILPAIQ